MIKVELQYVEDWELCDRVIRDGICQAKQSVWIATANVKDTNVPVDGKWVPIGKVFSEICRRGVEVRLLHAGVPSAFFLSNLKRHRLLDCPRFKMRRCPRVHFNTVIVDGSRLYLGSANLTGAGLGGKSENRRNFEAGILTADSQLLENVSSLFRVIWDGLMCEGCGRKSFCDVPLEGPTDAGKRDERGGRGEGRGGKRVESGEWREEGRERKAGG